MYISSLILKWCKKETFLELSYEYVNVFSVLRSIASGTIDINLRSCVLNRHKLQQSQIATIQESLPSQFVICRNLWSRPWRHKLSPITLKACYGYLREYPDSLLTWIWKVAYLPVLVLFQWYICLCVCISAIKPMLDVPRKPSWKGPILMWTCFLHLGVYPRLLWNLSEKLCFEPSQIARVTNCDTTVAICDVSHFVIKARDGANWVQQHWKRVLCTWESTHVHFWHEYENLHFCPFWCYFTGVHVFMYIRYNTHKRCHQGKRIEMVRCLCECVFCTWEYIFGHYWH